MKRDREQRAPIADVVAVVEPQMAEFGSVRQEMIPRDVINVLPQIRSVFDPIALEELAASIKKVGFDEDAGVVRYDMLENLLEGAHDQVSAQQYLKDYNMVNKTNVRLKDLIVHNTPDGPRWVIHIAGERRLRAGGLIIDRDGLSPSSKFMCAVEDNPSYLDALPKQFVENNSRINPPATDESRAIRKYYDAMKEIDPRYTHMQCSAAFSINPNKISDAITFTDYPESMQALAEHFPFSMVIEAKDLYDAWCAYHLSGGDVELDGADREEFISTTGKSGFEIIDDVATFEVETSFLKIKAERLRRRKDPHSEKHDVSLKKQTEDVNLSITQKTLGIIQGTLTFDGTSALDNYWSRRKLAGGALFRALIEAADLLDRLNMLTPDMRQRIGFLAVTAVDEEAELQAIAGLSAISA